jgi:hypothetical protein
MTHREKLYPLCEKMVQLALEIADQSTLTVTPRGMTEPFLPTMAHQSRIMLSLWPCLNVRVRCTASNLLYSP